jgi:hypothetical protein
MEEEDGAAGGSFPDPQLTLAERLEHTLVVRVLVSIVIVVLVGAQVFAHIPEGEIDEELRDDLRNPALTIQRLTTTEMQWGVFAPEPRRTSLRLEADVEFADGSTETWTVPQGAIVGSNLRFYRWRKWLERVRSDEYTSLWRPTAEWIASLYGDRPSPVTSVTLVRLFRDNRIRGPQEPYERAEYFTYQADDEIDT